MKKEESLLNLHEMSTSELLTASGGGEADDLSYVLTFGALATNPVYWAVRYSGWILKPFLT
jgi:hypothetical protein